MRALTRGYADGNIDAGECEADHGPDSRQTARGRMGVWEIGCGRGGAIVGFLIERYARCEKRAPDLARLRYARPRLGLINGPCTHPTLIHAPPAMFDAFPAALADAAIHPKSSLAPMDSCGLQVIQLLECPPPPPGPPRSTCASSSYASSSYDDVSEDEDDDEPCTSYCSSVSDLPEPTLSDPSRRAASSAAMSRITAWRKSSALRADDTGASDHFSPTPSLTRTPETSSAASGKRKLVHNGEGNEDSVGATFPFHFPLSHPLP